jgi:hypothetical protein
MAMVQWRTNAMQQSTDVHGSITLELRDRILHAVYSGELDDEAFASAEHRLRALSHRLYGHYWAMLADVSAWEQPTEATLAHNARLLDACLDRGMRLLANVVSATNGEDGTDPARILRPSRDDLPVTFQVNDFSYPDEAQAWLASFGY